MKRKAKSGQNLINKKRRTSYNIRQDDVHKNHVNMSQANFLDGERDKIIILDNVGFLTSSALVKKGIDPSQIIVVESDVSVYNKMKGSNSLNVRIVNDSVEDFLQTAKRMKISALYFDFTGNSLSLKMFEKAIEAMKRHVVGNRIYISTTFSVGRRGVLQEHTLYNSSLDVMEKVFSEHSLENGKYDYYYTYKRGRGMRMHYTQYVMVGR